MADRRLVAAVSAVGASIVVGSWLYFAESRYLRKWRRKWLEWRLRVAEKRVAALKHAVSNLHEHHAPVRIWMDGVFDLCHFGHMNAFRQGRAIGTQLVVGVNSGSSVQKEKGVSPVLSDVEREIVVRGCRFVDETVPSSPYTMDKDYVEHLRAEYKIDYIVHGDDACVAPDGSDVYADAKALGMFKTIPRTEGVSTTDILGRTLLLTTQHHCVISKRPIRLSLLPRPICIPGFSSKANDLLSMFSCVRQPRPDEKIVYVDGSFDMFHAGHVKVFEQARDFGDYVLVGVHSDEEVQTQKGGMYPLMNFEERILAILACRHVDDVLISAPWAVELALVNDHRIDVVCCGKIGDVGLKLQDDPYADIRGKGYLRQVDSGLDLSVEVILKRLEPARQELQQRYLRKREAEAEFWRNKKQ